MIYKSGFVNIIGFPNAGKSTLINSLVEKNISIVTHKPQTTRHRIVGILDKENFQIVFSDTPGIMKKQKMLIQKIMMKYVKKSIEDADIILLLTEVEKYLFLHEKIMNFVTYLKKQDIPIIILINKIDKMGLYYYNENILHKNINFWSQLFPLSDILPISALKNINKEFLIQKIVNLLSAHPPFYPKEWISDKSQRFFVNEIIREKIYYLYNQEIPYSSEVMTNFFKEENDHIDISSIIYVEKYSQKIILIGHNELSLNRLKRESKQSIKNFFKKEINISIKILVLKNWRSNYCQLKYFGY
ncbi:GTPase Era [Blattabacterium cuenoti]|uniref:GTPase Era n=1 Tax=Blattabacterium cuenoti TaxID=1653831 RepID=UPI00163BC78C|nr:GTPase Era [Blattabacterium cuenoti]